MKTRKNSKILILVLTLALLIGSVFAVTASAAEAETGDLYAVNVYHNDKLSVMFAVKATQAEIQNGTVQVKYTWNDENPTEEIATFHKAHPTKAGYVYVITSGVAAFRLTETVDFTVYVNDEVVESGTYSVAAYLYNKLYRDAVTGAEKDVYETLIEYGAASQVYFNHNVENMIDDVNYVYSKNANVKFGGKSYVLGSTAVTATYSGTGNVEAWIINGQEIASTATTYDVTVDGVVSVDIKVQCVHADVNPKDHNCDYCGANEFGTCADGDNDHNCDYCGAVLSECADTDSDHYCNVCNAKLSDCVDEGKDHVCDICKGNVGDHTDTDNDHNCNYCGEKLTDCTNENDDHYCDICGTKLPCVDANTDHKCDICGEGSDCWDNDGNYRCDGCGVYSFNSDMTNGEHGMIIYQGQSNDYETTANTVIYSNQVTGADRPAGYDYGAYYSIVDDPSGIANKVLKVNMPARVEEGGKYMNSHVRFTPDGAGDILVFDFDMYLSAENTQGVDGLYIYLVDDSVFNYDPKQGVAEPDNQDGQGYQKIIIQTASHSSGETRIKMCGQTTNAKADEWFGVRVIVNAATKTLSVYYTLDDGQTYVGPNLDWIDRTSTQVDLGNITSVGFKANTYRKDEGASYNTYVDNVVAFKTLCYNFDINADKNWDYCSQVDNNSDHLCDGCNDYLDCEFVDKNTDGKCDACGNTTFTKNITTGVNVFAFTKVSGNNADSTYAQTKITDVDPYGGTGAAVQNKYGVRLFRDADPENASNTVLKMVNNNNSKQNTTNNSSTSTLTFEAASTVDGGKIHVLEFDFYAYYHAKGGNQFGLLKLISIDSTGARTVLNNGFCGYTSITNAAANNFTFGENAGATETESQVLLDARKWYRIRVTFDQNTGEIYYDVSFDHGDTWYLMTTSSFSKTGLSAKTLTIGFQFDIYGLGGSLYFDNVNYTITDTAPARPTELGLDAVENAQ